MLNLQYRTAADPLPFDRTRCCICGDAVLKARSVAEERPTGNLESLETWYYCPGCWINMQSLRETRICLVTLLRELET